MFPEPAPLDQGAPAPVAREAAPIVGRLKVAAPGASRITVMNAYFDHVAKADQDALDADLAPGAYAVQALWRPGYREVERLLAVHPGETREITIEEPRI